MNPDDEIPNERLVWRLPKDLVDRILELRREGKTPEEAAAILKSEGRL